MVEPTNVDSHRHESDAIALRRIAFVAAGIAAFIIAGAFGIYAFNRALQNLYQRSIAVPVPPMVAGPPPQPAPLADLAAMRREQQAMLGTYGWVDRAHGIVRIPIERAMRLLVDRRANGGPAQP